MTTRQVLLLGGAALVLAACADSTAPGTQMRQAGVAASAKTTKIDTTSTSRLAPSTTTMTLECRGGFTVGAGRTDSTCVDEMQ